jgi:dihydrofolate reductase
MDIDARNSWINIKVMRKVILSVAVSLDGMIEGPNGEYDWCPPPSKKEMDDFLDKIDSIFLGRKSFELIGKSMFPKKEHYVFSTTLKKSIDFHLIGSDAKKKVIDLKKQPGKDIWLFGGAKLVTFFLNEKLVDEMWLAVVPIVLGKGKSLFFDIHQRTHFKLVEAVPKEGYVSLYYKYESK